MLYIALLIMLGYTSLTQPTGLGAIALLMMLGYISLTQPTGLGAIALNEKLKIKAKIR